MRRERLAGGTLDAIMLTTAIILICATPAVILYHFTAGASSRGTSPRCRDSAPEAPAVLPHLEAAKWKYLANQWAALKDQERRAMAHRLDCYFTARRSPMAGLGYYMVVSAERYGHDPRLCAAIAEAESTCGLACFAPHNAWGMLAYPSGWPTWEQGIDAMFDWLFKYNGVCTSAPRNWCEPPHPWMENVNGVMESI